MCVCLCDIFVIVVVILTIITKPVTLLVSYVWVTLRTISHAVYTLFATTVSLHRSRMYAHVQACRYLNMLLSCHVVPPVIHYLWLGNGKDI